MTDAEIAELRHKRYNGTVTWLHRVHSDLMILRVKPDFPIPPHQPGQYTTLGLGYWEPRCEACQPEDLKPDDLTRLVRRSYSLSCSVEASPGRLYTREELDWLEFYIVLVRDNPEGRVPALTPRLFMLKEGDRLNVGEKIAGHYTLAPVQPDDTVIFLSTGTGEAPHNYMLWQLLTQQHRGRILSVCCVRYFRDLGYREVHQRLMERYPHYTYVPLATREPGQSRKVYIQDMLTSGQLEEALGQPLDPQRTHVFLCGNPKMIGVPTRDKTTGNKIYPEPVGVIQLLEQRGFTADYAPQKIKGNIHYEEYW